jgi:hypothetical protein
MALSAMAETKAEVAPDALSSSPARMLRRFTWMESKQGSF